MPAQADLDVRQSPLRVCRPKHAGTGESAQTQLAVIGHEELVGGRCLEPLGAVPGHVLDHQTGAVGDEDHIEETVADDGAVEALDDVRQD